MTKTPTPWFDTRERLEQSVRTHEDFALVLAERRNWRSHNPNGGLQEWVAYGRFILDTYGQCMTIIKGAPEDNPICFEDGVVKRIGALVSLDEAKRFLGHWTSTFVTIPRPHDQCPHCLRGWEIRDLHDVASHLDEGVPVHRTCSVLKHYQSGFEQLQRIAHAVWPDAKLSMIPNEYDGRMCTEYDFRPPWALIHSQHGPIRIGWRRRVIDVSWSDAPKLKRVNGSEIVASVEITHGPTRVHCYSEASAIDALRLLNDAGWRA